MSLLSLLAGVVLLATGLLFAAQGLAAQRQQRASLQREAAADSAAFSAYLDRARGLVLLLAQNPTFTDPGPVNLAKANQALGYLQSLYPNAVSEACLIDSRGRELARVVRGVAAPAAELSSNETANPFFSPTWASAAGGVYQAPPYVSPDTDTWVMSNSTWLRRPDGSKIIVHFELTLASFQQYIGVASNGSHAALVDAETGQLLLTSDAHPATGHAALQTTSWSRQLAADRGTTAGLQVGGHAAVVTRVDRSAGGAGDWYVLRWSSDRAAFLPPWVGGAGAALGLLLVALALVSFRRQQSTLRAAARLDHLTGLANRKAVEEALSGAISGAANDPLDGTAVLVLDLDGFKQINDSLGHDRGDLVLREVARRLQRNVFEHDTAARLGGDEFAVVLRKLKGADDVEAVAHRLRDALVRPIDIEGMPHFVGVSVGAAVYPRHGSTGVDLLRGADAAMYGAKRAREGVRMYEPGTEAGAQFLNEAASLLMAIERAAITLAFQPVFSIGTGLITSVEALARWQPEGQPEVPPATFVALAEETGLIRPLTMLTIREALAAAAVWWAAGAHVPVSVNMSSYVLADRGLLHELLAVLAQNDVPARALILEVTGKAFISNRAATTFLTEARKAGIRVELDDFAASTASLDLLRSLPVDGIKIDGSIVQSGKARTLLAAAVELAHELEMYVVAEGVEDSDTVTLVRSAGCDRAQGYVFARPGSAAQLTELFDVPSTALTAR
jgi:diguanylate cyclase (GGDEF)-like protein